MRRWAAAPPVRRHRPGRPPRRTHRKPFSSRGHVEDVEVPCASSGSITVSLHNASSHPLTTPLVIYIPPFSPPARGGRAPLPPFLAPYPTAAIHYRWPESPEAAAAAAAGAGPRADAPPGPDEASPAWDAPAPPLHWPTPLHDALFGYEWLVSNLGPPGLQRRDVYVYGACLGAGLAAALALTEAHAHRPMAVRGLLAFNGVYDWTAFLPDHPASRARAESGAGGAAPDGGAAFHRLRRAVPALFRAPADLFDPFASPVLLFRTAGMLAPETFGPSPHGSALSPSLLRAIDELSGDGDGDGPAAAEPESPPRAPRRAYLGFPPRQSSLKIPETLLLHESPPPAPAPGGRRRGPGVAAAGRAAGRKRQDGRNDFGSQAAELAGVMRRSVDKLELKERMKWDDEFDGWEGEAERRVRVGDVGRAAGAAGGTGLELGAKGEEMAREWLEERMG